MTRGTLVALALCALILLAVPWIIGNEFYVNMASQVLIYALFALSINMMLGYGGMVSLGHAAYLGIAGYACILATLAGYDQLTAAIFAIALSTLAAALFGVLSLRAPGLGFIMITLALGQIVWGIAYRANDITGGDNGIRFPARPSPLGIDIAGAPSFYYFTLAVFAVALFCIWRLARSPFGAALRGTRDQPRRMPRAARRSRCDERAGAGSRRPEQTLRRPAGDPGRVALGCARRAPSHHRPERRRQDDAVQPGDRRPYARRRLGAVVRPGAAE